MTLHFMCGFDNFTQTDFESIIGYESDNRVFTSVTDRFGNVNGAVEYGEYNDNPDYRLHLPSIMTNPTIFGFAYRLPDTYGTPQLNFSIQYVDISPTYPQCSFVLNKTGVFIVNRLQSYNPAIEVGRAYYNPFIWNYFEIEIDLSTLGYCKVYINSTLAIDTGETDFYQDYVSANNVEGEMKYIRFNGGAQLDDFYFIEMDATSPNTALGEVHVDSLRPTANGTTNNGTASSGSNYECVDESAHNDDTDYVTLDAVDEIELYAIGNLSVTDGDIHAIQIRNVCKRTSSGSRAIQAILRINSTNYTSGVDIGVSTSYDVKNTQLFVLNPDDSAAWEIADINALESGIKITA